MLFSRASKAYRFYREIEWIVKPLSDIILTVLFVVAFCTTVGRTLFK
jgi:hypothetical protein